MFPIRDHNPSGRTPWVTYVLIAINSLIFLYMSSLSASGLLEFINNYALTPAWVSQGQKMFTVLSSIFMHGSAGHLLGNMLFLNIFGDNLEDRLGHVGYLFFYLVCGLGAAFLQIVIDAGSEIPMLGASGAIAGVMGGYLILFPRHQIDVLFFFGWMIRTYRLPAFTMLFYWLFAQLLSGAGALGVSGMGGVAYFAHIGGFISGLLIVWFVKQIGGGSKEYPQKRYLPDDILRL